MKLIHKLLITNLIITLLLVLTMFGLNAISNKRMLNNVFEDNYHTPGGSTSAVTAQEHTENVILINNTANNEGQY